MRISWCRLMVSRERSYGRPGARSRERSGMRVIKRWAGAVVLFHAVGFDLTAQNSPGADFGAAEKQFEQLCESCHGKGGAGGDRAPALTNNRALRGRTEAQIEETIKSGTPGGMPAFTLPESQLNLLAAWVRSLNASAFDTKTEGDAATGEKLFFGSGQCSTCHMVRGRGASNGPDLSDIGNKSTVRELALVLADPTSQMGIHTTSTCPNWAFCPDEEWAVVDVHLRNGSMLRGFARNRAEHDIQLQTFDGKFHLLTDSEYTEIAREKQSYMPAFMGTSQQNRDLIAYLARLDGTPGGPLNFEPPPITVDEESEVMTPRNGEWPVHNGVPGGNRYSLLTEINSRTVKDLQLQWVNTLSGAGLEMTPIVHDGIMYVTAPGEVCALDARSGRQIWCYNRAAAQRTPAAGGRGNAGGGGGSQPNRGVALLGDRIFYTTTDAHLLCLNRLTGGLMWDVSMGAPQGRGGSISAPLVVGDLVISGINGGDSPLRGFLSAYKAATGQLAWRFWTIPNPGEPNSETWIGNALPTGGGATWVTGSYDVETRTLFWCVGNPYPATDGDQREGSNLYTNSVLALDPDTGKLRWYYQFTPHDLHDYDATEPLALVDAEFQGRERKLVLQANRNGFLYVLDRTNGQLLLAKPFVKKLNWASGIGPDGKPQLLPANKPTKAGVKTCPAVRGATNWYSTAFNPVTRLFYVMAVEDCSIYRQSGNGGYEGFRDPSDPGLRYLRAYDISTGNMVWQNAQEGSQEANYTGVLATAGGVVFYGETGGAFAAADAKTGKILWRFQSNQSWRSSPMTYLVNGRQYVTAVSGGTVLTFALPARN